jgi:uncharacterized protein YbjT (DUF2867 family)
MLASMKILLFGATGMIGQGVLRECLLDPGVESVAAIGRSPSGQTHPKLRDLVQRDLFDYSAMEPQFDGLDACFFCLGTTSVGMSETDYTRVTFDLTLAAACSLAKVRPGMTFIYVSGAGADSTERSGVMWARVRGRTENAVLALPLRACVFRLGVVQPLHGIQSRTAWIRFLYWITRPVMSAVVAMLPPLATTTEAVGRAMLEVARHGALAKVLDNREINLAAKRYTLQ